MGAIAVILVVSLLLLVVALVMAPRLTLTILAALLLALFSFGALVALAGVAGFVLWLAACVVAPLTLMQLRINRQRALLDLLAFAAEKQLPLTSVVRAFAADQPGGGRRLSKFADDLQSGLPLGQALLLSPSVLPRQAMVAAQMGERTATLDSGLRQVASNYTYVWPLRQALIVRVFYLAAMAFLMPAIVSFFVIKIIPAFVKIFEDFEIELPTMTVLVIKLVGNHWVQLIAGFAPLLAVALLLYVSLYYIGVVTAPTFGFGRWTERGPVLRALALAVESQRPLAESLDRLADCYPKWAIARRLRAAASDVAGGRDWIQSLVKYRLVGRSAAGVIQSAERVGNLPWAMRQVAENSERRLVYRLETALNIISPLVILALAGVVGFFVIGCFLPLVKLISSLT